MEKILGRLAFERSKNGAKYIYNSVSDISMNKHKKKKKSFVFVFSKISRWDSVGFSLILDICVPLLLKCLFCFFFWDVCLCFYLDLFGVRSIENDFIDVFVDMENLCRIWDDSDYCKSSPFTTKDYSSLGIYIFGISIVGIRRVEG